MGTALLVGSQKSSLTRCSSSNCNKSQHFDRIIFGILSSIHHFTDNWLGWQILQQRFFSHLYRFVWWLWFGIGMYLWMKKYICTHKCFEKSMYLIHTQVETMWKNSSGLLHSCQLDHLLFLEQRKLIFRAFELSEVRKSAQEFSDHLYLR